MLGARKGRRVLSRKGLTEKVTSEQKQYRRGGEEPPQGSRGNCQCKVSQAEANEAGAEQPGVSEEGGQGRRGQTMEDLKPLLRTFPLSDQEVTGGLGAQEWQDLTTIYSLAPTLRTA